MFPARFFAPRYFPRPSGSTIPGTSQRQRIHDALIAIANAGEFQSVTYGSDGLLTVGDVVTPASVRANEVSSSFAEDRKYRRSYRQQRGTWRWKLLIAFQREVSLEVFEEDLLRTPKYLTPSSGLAAVRLKLVDAAPKHPTQHEAASGTSVTYTFEAHQYPA